MGYPYIIACIGLLCASLVQAADFNRYSTSKMSPSDYLLGNKRGGDFPTYDPSRTIDLDLDIGVGSDCGRIDIRKTLRASLKNILDAEYLGAMGRDIVGSSPMLLTCYMSPTWCAILKHSRIRANFLSQLRLNQCKAINRFVDGRVSDYYEERSKCIQRAIKQKGGNFEAAMEECKNYRDYNIASWAGDRRTRVNKLVESTAQWAGMTDSNSKRVVDLTKAFIGDSIIKNGKVSVDFGPRRVQLSPRTYLNEIKSQAQQALCVDLLGKLMRSGGYQVNIYRAVSEEDLKELNGKIDPGIDHQTLRALTLLPKRKRDRACRKLANALAMSRYTDDMGKTLDFISSKLLTNPHLPEKRKREAELKRKAFKDHVEITLAIEERSTTPLNKVLYQINQQGQQDLEEVLKQEIYTDERSHLERSLDGIFFDCGDGIGCR